MAKPSRPAKSGHAGDSTPRLDVHQAITDKIVRAIEDGAGAFEMPWHRPGTSFAIPSNVSTGNAYQGSNILSLWIDADDKKFQHPLWATFRQWQELGAAVNKGEKGSLIIKWGDFIPKGARIEAEARGETLDEDEARRRYAKAAFVFNIDQVTAPSELRDRLLPAVVPRPDLTQRLACADAFIAATGAEFREGGQRAFYRHPAADGSGDFIQMPPRNLFTGTKTSTPTEAYEGTRLHELTHWTGAVHRLARDFGKRFGDKAYAFEELVAELSAAFLCAHLEVTNTPRPDHAQYLASWLDVLKGDSKAIFAAASLATEAVKYLIALQPPGSFTPDSTAGKPADEPVQLPEGGHAYPTAPPASQTPAPALVPMQGDLFGAPTPARPTASPRRQTTRRKPQP